MFLSMIFGVIFYWQATGEVYGVHKDLATAPKVPQGVVSLEVPETPDKIAWPVPVGQNKGHERWTIVDTTTNPATLKVNPKFVFEPDPDVELAKAIEAATTLQELKDALLGKIGAGKIKGKPVK